ncbi:ABC transporter substrate-binding protein [Paenibacillus hamazuiensis]|uniref:ABC transporter substrate-binding protein n=1 Tax=Paenibacillus hamazuiensis TaxID=2936508 RepID=UPI00200D07C9|nr:ABC transporter substrate-binding protein [Paenibacillus hamazuiensis]
MISKRKITLLSCVLSLAVASGCAGSGSGSGGAKDARKSEAAQPAASSASKENVTLRFSWWGNEVRHKATIDVINLYMKKNPNVTIKAEYRGKSERELIATGLAGGSIADIVQLNPPWMEDFTRNSDFFVDFNTKKNLIDLSGIDPQFLKENGVFNNKLVGLPMGVNATIGIMNKTVADKFGIPSSLDTKWTWDDFYKYGKTVNQKDPESYMLNMDIGSMVEFVLKRYIVQKTGKHMIGDDYSLGFTRDDLAEALTYINKLYTDKVAIPASDAQVFNDAAQTNPKWINGKAVMVFSWTSTVSPYTNGVKGEFVPIALPVREGAKNTALIVKPPQVVAVSNRSKHIDEAVKFVNFFLNDIEANKILKDTRSISAVKPVADAVGADKLYDPVVLKGHEYGMKNMGLGDNGPTTNGEIIEVLENAVEIVAYPNANINKVTDDSMKLINDIVKTMKK